MARKDLRRQSDNDHRKRHGKVGSDVYQGGACHDRNVKQTAANGPLWQGAPGGIALARDEPLHST